MFLPFIWIKADANDKSMNQDDLMVLKAIKELLNYQESREVGAEVDLLDQHNENTDVKTTVKQLNDQISELSAKFERYDELVRKLSQQNNRAKTASEGDWERMKNKIESLESQIDSLNQLSERIHEQYDQIKEEVDQKAPSQEQDKLELLEGQLGILHQRTTKLEEQMDLLKKNYQETAQSQNQSKEKINSLEGQIGSLTKIFESTNEQFLKASQAKTDASPSSLEIGKIKERLSGLEGQLASLDKIFEKTNEQLLKVSRESGSISSRAHTDLEGLKEKVKQLETTRNRLQETLDEQQKSWEKAQEKAQQKTMPIEEKVDRLIEKINHLEYEISLNKQENTEPKTPDFSTWEEKIEQVVQQINRLESQINQPTDSPADSPVSTEDQEKTQDNYAKAKQLPSTETNEGPWAYMDQMQEVVFKNEEHLRTYFPKSFLLIKSKQNFPTSFFWIGEKIGLTYLAVFSCQSQEDNYSFLPLMAHFTINSLIIESKLMDASAIMDEMDKRLAAVLEKKQADAQIRGGLCVIDKTNSTLYFIGANTDLIINHRTVQRLEGNKAFIGELNQEGIQLKKHTIPTHKGARFYIAPAQAVSEESQGKSLEIDQQISQMKNLDMKVQKMELEKYLSKTDYQELILLGFNL